MEILNQQSFPNVSFKGLLYKPILSISLSTGRFHFGVPFSIKLGLTINSKVSFCYHEDQLHFVKDDPNGFSIKQKDKSFILSHHELCKTILKRENLALTETQPFMLSEHAVEVDGLMLYPLIRIKKPIN